MSEVPPVADTPKIEGSMFLFREPELLTKEKFAGKGISKPDRPYAFCDSVRAVPITVTEIPMVQKNYPIIFAEPSNPMPMAVVGLVDEVNLFVDDQGNWDADTYIPGYVRRYPFALANDNNSDRMAIVVDAGYEGINDSPEINFFENDEISEATKGAMDFCSNYERDRAITVNFAQTLAGFNLVASQVAQFTPEGGESQPFAQYTGVDEKLLSELEDEKFLELRKANIIPILYAQLMSMGNWRVLMDRRARRFDLQGEAVLKPMPKQ